MLFNLEGQVALVAGGAKGIGSGIVEALAAQGAKVIVGDIAEEDGRKVAEKFNGEFKYLDVTDGELVQKVVNEIIEDYGKIDILAHNTGVYPNKKLEDITSEDWDNIFELNVKGMFNVVKPVIASMKKAEFGRVILTSSVTGDITGYVGGTHYGATKAAILGFMRNAAVEYAKHGVTVNAIQPGLIGTESLFNDLGNLAGGTDYIPIPRLGEPMDIGAAAAFFASKETGYITGQTIVVDGGQVLPETPDAMDE